MERVLIIDDKERGLPRSIKDLFEDALSTGSLEAWPTQVRSLTIETKDLPPFGDREGISEGIGRPEDVMSAIADTNILLMRSHAITARVIDAAADLRFIGILRGNGLNVDVAAAVRRGIACVLARGRNSDTIADFTMALLIDESRGISRAWRALEDGTVFDVWNAWPRPVVPMAGKTLGVVGLGHIGKEVVKRAKGFDMRIVIADPYVASADAVAFGDLVDLPTLLRVSDFIAICASLTPETRHMIGAAELALMKTSAVIVNTARGAIIDEKALYEALRERRIRGAALDVFENDHPIDLEDPLLHLGNVTATPHMAGWPSERSNEVGAAMIVESLRKFLAGKPLSKEELCDPVTRY